MGHELARSVLILFEDASPHVAHPNYFNINEEKYCLIYESTIGMLETMAIVGHIAIQYQLGVFFDCEEDDKSFEWLTLASKANITDACYRLGVLYEEGRGTKQDYSEAIYMYQKASKNDHEDALYRLARLYQYGNGTEQDYIQAYQLYSRAAEHGQELAFKVLNITKKSNAPSVEKAHNDYFDDSSDEFKNSILMCEFVGESGDINMQYKLGIYYEDVKTDSDYSMALKWFTMASTNSHRDARYRLGFLYERGLGTEQDYQSVVSLYNLAKEQGSDNAIYRLGAAYHYGRGVEVDFDYAIRNYIYAAELGNSESQLTLGVLYETGEITEKNILQAVVWYTKSYRQNNNNAISSLHKIYSHEPYDSFFYKRLFQISSKFHRVYKSSDISYKETYGSMYHTFGSLYNEGLGVEQNYESALEMFSIAAHRYHNADSREILRLFFTNDDLHNKNQYLKMIDTFWIIRESIDPVLQCLLGNVYYLGIDIVMSKDELLNKLSQGLIEYPIGKTKKKGTLGTLVPVDYSKAFEYYTLSASNKNRIAQFRLADLYFQGLGVERDENAAIEMYSNVITDQNHLSCYLSQMYQTGKNKSQEFEKAAEYNKQVNGISYADAIRDRGILYEYGDSLEQSYEKAIECYKEATQFRHRGALFSLGLMYYYGKGVDRDYGEALNYFSQLASGLPGAFNSYVYVESKDCENENQPNHEYSMQDETPITGEAHYYLGVMYQNGLGTEVNQQRANHHFQVASDYYHLGYRMILG
jgi:TPR repeat protein